MQAFVALWTHRYRKSRYLVFSYATFAYYFIFFKLRKFFTGQQNVAILLAEQFGDIVACEPVSRYVRQQYPNEYLLWIVRKPFNELVRYNPSLDSIHLEYSVLESILHLKYHTFDILVNLHISNRFAEFTRQRLVNPRADALGITVFTYYFHGCLLEVFSEIAGLPRLKESPQVPIPAEIRQRIDALQLPAKYMVFHAQSNQASRNWRTEYWQKLANKLSISTDYQIVEVGLTPQLSVDTPQYRNLCGQLSLLETAEVIRRASYFIGIDSGPAHFANAFGVYGFILLGKLADFDAYIPYSGTYGNQTNAVLIREPNRACSELPYDKVWEVVSERLHIQNHHSL